MTHQVCSIVQPWKKSVPEKSISGYLTTQTNNKATWEAMPYILKMTVVKSCTDRSGLPNLKQKLCTTLTLRFYSDKHMDKILLLG